MFWLGISFLLYVWHCTILNSTHISTLFVLFKDNGSPAGEITDDSIPKRVCVLGSVYLKSLLIVWWSMLSYQLTKANKPTSHNKNQASNLWWLLAWFLLCDVGLFNTVFCPQYSLLLLICSETHPPTTKNQHKKRLVVDKSNS